MESMPHSNEQPLSFTVSGEEAGQRLDTVVVRLLPHEGLRARRRLCASGAVLVNGRPGAKGLRVGLGDRIELLQPSEAERSVPKQALLSAVTVIEQSPHYAALLKPPGLHSESLPAGFEAGVSEVLPELFPGRPVELLNRLDRQTGGLLLVALSHEAGTEYRRLQDRGEVLKEYLAVVQGRIAGPVEVRAAIDAADRPKVRVAGLEKDIKRWTGVVPLHYSPDHGRTLVLARILKGRRHQIRAHLAHCGHPIVGDEVYGSGREGRMYLHHYRISFPGFIARSRPVWVHKDGEGNRWLSP